MRPVVESVNNMGSRDSTEVVVELTFSQVAVAGLPLTVTRSVSSPAWNKIFPEFQFTPMEGSPALEANPDGGTKFW